MNIKNIVQALKNYFSFKSNVSGLKLRMGDKVFTSLETTPSEIKNGSELVCKLKGRFICVYKFKAPIMINGKRTLETHYKIFNKDSNFYFTLDEVTFKTFFN